MDNAYPMIPHPKHVVILSPHLDDAVFSASTLIQWAREHQIPVTVLSVCTASPKKGDASEAIALYGDPRIRRKEDRNALKPFNCQLRWLGHLDSVFRLHPKSKRPLYGLNPVGLKRASQFDRPLQAQLKKQIQAVLTAKRRPHSSILVAAPLGIGGHIDHIICRDALRAAASLFDTASVITCYYEDWPYSQNKMAGKHIQTLIRSLDLTTRVRKLTAFKQKLRACLAYRSQIPHLFGSRRGLEDRLKRSPFECFWTTELGGRILK